jgi:hypothetical protein
MLSNHEANVFDYTCGIRRRKHVSSVLLDLTHSRIGPTGAPSPLSLLQLQAWFCVSRGHISLCIDALHRRYVGSHCE